MVLIMSVCSCSNDQKSKASGIDNSDFDENRNWADSIYSTNKKDKLGIMFYHTKPFEILSFQKDVTLEYTGPDDTTECKNWRIDGKNLHTIFKNSEPISGTTWDLAFVFTTCVATGQIRQNEEVFDYSINAGSWFRVTCRDTSLLYGDFNSNDRKFFLYNADTN